MKSQSDSVTDLLTTRHRVSEYGNITTSSTTHVTELNVVSGSGVMLSRPAAEVIASTLVMSVCIAATIFGNVLVVLSVFTYWTLILSRSDLRIPSCVTQLS